MEDYRHRTSAAVLIRPNSQWSTAQRTSRALLKTGATVMLVFLGFEAMAAQFPLLDCLGLECYADTRQKDMICLPVVAIAAILKRCDLVVPV
ncbi:MAG: hypothetical protein P8X96_21870 [Desulfobacteraceae bacterium]